ncbi:cupin domain-containing protein [Legionella tucsonensis]|uniref:Mannose-6-phosphate isomerase n=1 Tax=Legionella tucsonensis TaxID=40335 RepID=A0A0W0ZP89_9GAMM|nr:cupin domain-containing protein [Legionella tucsonensis]KTD70884.1 Mannose-6-phosphate isomerase [Legionella tucsonensis]
MPKLGEAIWNALGYEQCPALALNSPFQITYFQVLPNNETSLAYHQEEIWIVLNGSGVLTYEGTAHRLNAHDIFYFASLKKHQIHNPMQIPLIICSIYWESGTQNNIR